MISVEMEDTELDFVSQLLETDDFHLSDSVSDKGNNGELCLDTSNCNLNNTPITSSIEPSEADIEMEMKLIKERMLRLQEQLRMKKSGDCSENSQACVSQLNNSETGNKVLSTTDIPKIEKNKNRLKDVDIGIFSSESASLHLNRKGCNTVKSRVGMTALHCSEVHDSDEEADQSCLSETGRKIKQNLATTSRSLSEKITKPQVTWNTKVHGNKSIGTEHANSEEDIQHDLYSGLRIINPVVSSSTIKARMEGRKFIRMSTIHLHMRGNDIEGDWVTSGVIVRKIPPATSKNGKMYSIWKMSDLKNCDNIVSLFLFGEIHKQFWKTNVGMVVAFLNASIMPDRKPTKSDDISLSVDHPGKMMILGTSKDLGFCRSRKKNGQFCQAVVNLSQGEYCQYHVKREYSRLSRKRVELQTSYSGTEPKCLRNKILNKQPVIYGGQMFNVTRQKTSTSKGKKCGQQLILDSFKLQRKAEHLANEERQKYVVKKQLHLNERENSMLMKISSQSGIFAAQLSAPTAGSRNFLRHLVKEEDNTAAKKGTVKSITAKDLLKMHKEQLDRLKECGGEKNSKTHFEKLQQKPTSVGVPQLGRGLKPSDFISLDIGMQKLKSDHFSEMAKLKAIQTLNEKGPLCHQNPNAVKKQLSPETIQRIKKRLRQEDTNKQKSDPCSSDNCKRSKLGELDLNSKKIEAILNRKSSHAHEVEMEDLEKQDEYFNHLEKKEQMENKMMGVTEILCDVVSCRKCLYTAHKPSELCKNENHPMKCHKAIKRFFQCADCKHRTWAFTKLPKHCCRNCGSSSFERTSMMKPKEVKLSNETLLIRGEEQKFLS